MHSNSQSTTSRNAKSRHTRAERGVTKELDDVFSHMCIGSPEETVDMSRGYRSQFFNAVTKLPGVLFR